jgi:hypothetical protein
MNYLVCVDSKPIGSLEGEKLNLSVLSVRIGFFSSKVRNVFPLSPREQEIFSSASNLVIASNSKTIGYFNQNNLVLGKLQFIPSETRIEGRKKDKPFQILPEILIERKLMDLVFGCHQNATDYPSLDATVFGVDDQIFGFHASGLFKLQGYPELTRVIGENRDFLFSEEGELIKPEQPFPLSLFDIGEIPRFNSWSLIHFGGLMAFACIDPRQKNIWFPEMWEDKVRVKINFLSSLFGRPPPHVFIENENLFADAMPWIQKTISCVKFSSRPKTTQIRQWPVKNNGFEITIYRASPSSFSPYVDEVYAPENGLKYLENCFIEDRRDLRDLMTDRKMALGASICCLRKDKFDELFDEHIGIPPVHSIIFSYLFDFHIDDARAWARSDLRISARRFESDVDKILSYFATEMDMRRRREVLELLWP